MRICRYILKSDPAAGPRVGVLEGETVRDVTAVTDALPALRWPLPPGDHLIASLEDIDLDRQWADEAIRRRDEVRSGKVRPVPAKEVYRRIERLLGK